MRVLLITILLCNILLMCYSSSSETNKNSDTNAAIDLTISDFDSHINTKSHLVMFYAPWCGHCKLLHPIWEKYAAAQIIESDLITIAKVDCTLHTALCAKHEINGYPTIKLFNKGSQEGIKYKGTRDIDSFNAFVREEFGITEKTAVTEPTTGFIEHTDATFAEEVKTGFHFIKFYAPWCGHCQRLASTWEALGKDYKDNKNISIGKVDCTKFKSICTDYEIKGYPTLLLLSDSKTLAKYTGDRSLPSLSDFVRENLNSVVPEIQASGTVQSSVIILNHENFETVISSGVTLVKFFAPWCGHCKRLSPTYEELGEKFQGNDIVNIARIDCTQEHNRDYCSKQSVNGFPSLFLYKNGKKIGEYVGDRSLENLFTFINGHLSHDEL